MSDLHTRISVAELQALLDGGDENDWIPILKVRQEAGCVQAQVTTIHGEQISPDAVLRPGDSFRLTYTFDLVS